MKKVILILTMVLLLAGCSKNEAAQTSGNSSGTDTTSEQTDNSDAKDTDTSEGQSEGFQFVYNDVTIPMNVDAAPITKALGDPMEYFEAASCAFQGLDKTYTYSGFELTTYPDEKKDMISTVYFLDDSVSTDKGISIGSTLEDVKAAYGEDYTENSGEYVYTLGSTKLSFIVEEDSVTSITYAAIVEGLNN